VIHPRLQGFPVMASLDLFSTCKPSKIVFNVVAAAPVFKGQSKLHDLALHHMFVEAAPVFKGRCNLAYRLYNTMAGLL